MTVKFRHMAHVTSLFPEEGGYRIIENKVGHSDSKVFLVEKDEVQVYILKCQPKAKKNSLSRDRDNLEWLREKLPVPKVIWYRIALEWEWLLMSYIPGVPSFEWGKSNAKEVGTLLGETLKLIHQIPYQNYFDQQNKSLPAKEILEKEESKSAAFPMKWDLVFCHGDFCLPNILIGDGQVAGIIDVGNAGIFDRYQDIYWAIWSFNYNQLDSAIPSFLEAYGIDTLDEQKMKYFAAVSNGDDTQASENIA